jgi:glycosyltransferase involved in cell wall biosynthesis
VVNGGNCAWPDVNWVHAVHGVWGRRDRHAPLSFRLRAALSKRRARIAERRSLQMARAIITNSQRARQQLIDVVGVPADRVRTVYYGIDPEIFRPASAVEKADARRRLELPGNAPVVAFAGALGYDRNKGFDVLFEAWERLCADPAWDGWLVAAGTGAEVALWRRRASARTVRGLVRMLGFTTEVPTLMASADALVSPTHYDAYGLSVHEALCSGLPAFVTATAGIAERYPDTLSDLLLTYPPDATEIAERLRRWRADTDSYRSRVAPFASYLRRRTWADMAGEMLESIQDPPKTDLAWRK